MKTSDTQYAGHRPLALYISESQCGVLNTINRSFYFSNASLC
jgi:hypothetical protein